jgi:hypothetical protein
LHAILICRRHRNLLSLDWIAERQNRRGTASRLKASSLLDDASAWTGPALCFALCRMFTLQPQSRGLSCSASAWNVFRGINGNAGGSHG